MIYRQRWNFSKFDLNNQENNRTKLLIKTLNKTDTEKIQKIKIRVEVS